MIPTGTATPAAIAAVLDLDDEEFEGLRVAWLLDFDDDVVVI